MSRCVQMSGSHFKLLRFSSPIISQIRLYLREIVDFYKGIFARIAKKLSITVLNLRMMCYYIFLIYSPGLKYSITFPLSPQFVVSISLTALHAKMSASDLESGNCRTGFSKHSVSFTLIILCFGSIYAKQSTYTKKDIFVSIAKKLSIYTVLCCANFLDRSALFANLGIT